MLFEAGNPYKSKKINYLVVRDITFLCTPQKTYKYFALFIILAIIAFILCNLIMQFNEVENDSLWLRTRLNSWTIFK